MKEFIKLLRVKHYIKNYLIFIPLFFAGELFDSDRFLKAVIGFFAFCVVSSIIYIINDLKDVEKDKNHPKKKNRPIASGKICKKTAIGIIIIFLVIATILLFELNNMWASVLVCLYIGLNIAYSFGLKNKPIVDVVILSSGFVIRIIYGGVITNIPISGWLYLVVVAGSLYMGLGKRRNELKEQINTREVLQYYNVPFLDKNMYVCIALVNVFYALWAMESSDSRMIWTVPFFIIILMSYSLEVEGESDGDPVEVILHDKYLIGLITAYVVLIFLLLYIFS